MALHYVFSADFRNSFILYSSRILIAFLGCHQSSESIDDALASNLKYIKSKNCQKKKKFKCNACDYQATKKSNLRRHQKKKKLNAMNVITNPLKKVILEDIKKKI